MENKFYGMKPSYKIMKEAMKTCTISNKPSSSYYKHANNLVYYCIKHDFNEQQVIEYLTKQADKCEKYLDNHDSGAHIAIEYEYLKDVFNIDMSVFKLVCYKRYAYKYDYENHLWDFDLTKEVTSYGYVRGSVFILPKNFFRDYNEHSVFLYDMNTVKNIRRYRGLITYDKIYSTDEDIDKVYVDYRENIIPSGGNKYSLERVKKEFIDSCLGLWHFMKLADCSEHPNDINIDDIYRRLEISETYDHRESNKKIYELERPRIQKRNENT